MKKKKEMHNRLTSFCSKHSYIINYEYSKILFPCLQSTEIPLRLLMQTQVLPSSSPSPLGSYPVLCDFSPNHRRALYWGPMASTLVWDPGTPQPPYLARTQIGATAIKEWNACPTKGRLRYLHKKYF